MSHEQRAQQQQFSKAVQDNAHRRLHMTRGRRKFWSDCNEVQQICLRLFLCTIRTRYTRLVTCATQFVMLSFKEHVATVMVT